jgi:hypothetical protein
MGREGGGKGKEMLAERKWGGEEVGRGGRWGGEEGEGGEGREVNIDQSKPV